MSPESRRELRRLLSSLCDGALGEAEHARLEELLEEDPACRWEYLQYMDLHARLLTQPDAASERGGELAQPADVAASRRRRRAIHLLGYLGVAAATLALSLVAQFLWLRPRGPAPETAPVPTVQQPPSSYVATLTQTANCVWASGGEPLRTGSRIVPGELRLKNGLARIHFDTGSELLVEGPAELIVESGTAVAVVLGKMVFRTDDAAVPLDVHTPGATLLELGTEYAVQVNAEGEEVHVFEGEVQRVPRGPGLGSAPEHLKAGEARRFGNTASLPSQPVTLDPTRFVRRMSAPDASRDLSAGLLAYEGFDYRESDALHTGRANGGSGWGGPWMLTAGRPPPRDERTTGALRVDESLVRPGAMAQSIGGRFDQSGFAVYYRRLAEPIRMDLDGVYYLSCLVRRQTPIGHSFDTVSLMLRPTEDPQRRPDLAKRLSIGVSGSNQVFSHLGRTCSRASLPLSGGTTYLLVAKIVTSGSSSDQVFVRVYGPRETIGLEEPGSWTAVGPPFQSDLVFDWLGVHVNSKNRQMVDEIRLGATWPSVVAPWIARTPAPAENKP
jgi:ferric-dicitrate binding protein FerR (iron transport regulator)